MVKNLPGSAGDIGDSVLIPRWGDPIGDSMATLSHILAWRIPWEEELGMVYSLGRQSWTRLK